MDVKCKHKCWYVPNFYFKIR